MARISDRPAAAGPRWPVAGDGYLAVLIGVAGSGKSTLASQAWPAGHVLSLDSCRGWVSGDSCDQDCTADAVSVLLLILEARMRRHVITVVDATNVRRRERRPWVAAARRCGVPAAAVVLTTPLQASLARNAARPPRAPGSRWGRQVPEPVIREQHAALLAGLPGLRSEGFACVTTWPAPRVPCWAAPAGP